MKPSLTSPFFITFLLFGKYALLAGAHDFESPRIMALGGAGAAAPTLNDAIYVNPSFTSFTPAYSFAVNYAIPISNPDLGIEKLFNVSLLDGRTELFQAGIGYTHRTSRKDIHLGASRAIIKELGFGIGGKFIILEDTSFSDVSVSSSFLLFPWLQGAVIVDNLVLPDEAKAAGMSRNLALATKANVLNIILLYFDPEWIFSNPSGDQIGYSVALETQPFRDLFLRFGFTQNRKNPVWGSRENSYSTGFAWISPRFSIDYAFSWSPKPRATEVEQLIAHQLGLTFYF